VTAFALDYRDTLYARDEARPWLANRLNWRAHVCFTRHRDLIAGQRLLDLASHDGRLAYACATLGAGHIVGIEGRPEQVVVAREHFKTLGVRDGSYEFHAGDLHAFLEECSPGQFDTILCCGFFYHTIRHVEILRQFNRLAPRAVILDTQIALGDPMVMEFDFEDTASKLHTIDAHGLIGRPSRSLTEALLRVHGFEPEEVKWHDLGVDDWSGLEPYRNGSRTTWVARRRA
jgi:2-polyprenyl-3-methyl-5-hydroxy-6-metoxy-1,4-benzoquinol methylase